MMTIVDNMQATSESLCMESFVAHQFVRMSLTPLPPKVVLHCHVPGLSVHCDCGPTELADCPNE